MCSSSKEQKSLCDELFVQMNRELEEEYSQALESQMSEMEDSCYEEELEHDEFNEREDAESDYKDDERVLLVENEENKEEDFQK